MPSADKGEVNITINAKPFSQLYVLAVDLHSIALRQVDIEGALATQKRDLSLNQSLSTDGQKGFSESRMTVEVVKGDTYSIDDITSSEI